MHYILPILVAAALWWSSTGAILALTRLPRATWPLTAGVATLVGLGATGAIIGLRTVDTPMGAYLGFGAGLAMWAWHEVMFLLGYITGARRSPCPPDLTPRARFAAATQTVLHHEIAIALHALAILALSWGATNQTAGYTFALLWVMRLSIKFVLFFGAPRLPDHVMPPHLAYLTSYFRQRQDGSVLSVALAVTFGLAVGLAVLTLRSAPGGFAFIGHLLLTTLAGLAVLEHAALRLNLPDRLLGVSPSPARTPVPAPGTPHEPSRI